jgi:hypothetical protein
MRYILLIYSRESEWTGLSDREKGVMMQQYGAFTDSLKKGGHYVAGDGLEPTTTATTVRVRNGKTVSTDGPFAETREQLGGYYVIKAADLDEASAIAARVPGATTGSIEVRPIMETGG